MNKYDIIDLFGPPDRILPAGQGMTSTAWLCFRCRFVHQFDQPERSPSPCSKCGGIVFEKRDRIQH